MKDAVQLQTKVYYYNILIRSLLCFIYIPLAFSGFCLAMLLVEMLQTHSFEGLFGWLCGLGLVLFFAYGTIPLWNTRLELSPEGVTYTNPGYYRIYTPWENIERIVRLSRFRTSTSFILRIPATTNIKFLEGKQQHLAIIERCSLLTTKAEVLRRAYSIPLMALMPKKDLENGTFSTYLQQYAPHLSYV
ncbi:hypothetical protein [Ktedonospora formicarum]|uniref:Uncharacterized protein n=1 Tax=Ktedonospora formicarum TaxID=2778364 RepID=A0A8J3I6T1_9CHLR|nr:hypothetical protein [Ktedonospora formicarum]GHO48466.1 hypothetical protein KSX_66290 [Ktedonospora formicarum]